MTSSEWIEKLRAAAAMCQSQDDELDYKYWAAVAFDMLPKASAYIDQQAASLDEAEALTRRNVELINGYMARITELEAQVAALQEIAVSEGANNLFNGPWDGGLPVEASYDATMEKAKEDARRQLSEEHPEAFG